MKLKELESTTWNKSQPLRFAVGPFAVSVKSDFDSVFSEIRKIYGEFELLSESDFVDFEINLNHPDSLIRRYFRPQCIFTLGNNQPFTPIGAKQAYPMFEWAFNWCISSHCHQYLMLHAAVIERNGVCVCMPAPPGSGKSTLTAILAYSGWRLLSDELALIDITTGLAQPLARPINLKNHSIDVIKKAFPDAVHSEVVSDTHKGDVCLFKPPANAFDKLDQPAKITHVIFPKYTKGQALHVDDMEQHKMFFELIDNSFNYNILGLDGFNTLVDTVAEAQGYQLSYSDQQEVLAWFEELRP